MGLWDIPAKHEICDTELRFNPYHDPTTGRFTTANGGSSGGYLYSKGGKSALVFNVNKGEDFDDDEYEKWREARKRINPDGTLKRFVNNSGWYSQKMRTDYNDLEEKVNKTRSMNMLLKYRKRAEGNQKSIKASIESADYSRDKNINTVKLRQFDRKYDSLIKNIDEKMR